MGKLGIRRDYPRHRIEMKFCMVGGLQMQVLRMKFHQNRLSGLRAVGGRNLSIPLTWPLAYTTACTVVQAVMLVSVIQIHCNEHNYKFSNSAYESTIF